MNKELKRNPKNLKEVFERVKPVREQTTGGPSRGREHPVRPDREPAFTGGSFASSAEAAIAGKENLNLTEVDADEQRDLSSGISERSKPKSTNKITRDSLQRYGGRRGKNE